MSSKELTRYQCDRCLVRVEMDGQKGEIPNDWDFLESSAAEEGEAHLCTKCKDDLTGFLNGKAISLGTYVQRTERMES